ncbi:MAG TPA: PfkB family carbohydrate kinase, partial [Candidatus Limnocylindrales bacterium]|nr:PfkB family carbohydrate kinase [Candidatus Limnocylindrales bacterium]
DVLVLVDPNCRPTITPEPDVYRARIERVLRRADIVKVSTEDLAFLRPGESPMDGAAWAASLGARAVLVTDGAAPLRVLAGAQVTAVDVAPVQVVDTVGAGDTFGGATLACLVAAGVTRASLHVDAVVRAARFGTRAAAIVCTRAGADPPTLAELGGWPAA